MSPTRIVLAALAAVALAAAPARAEFVIDLTKAGSTGTANGALYYQADPQPTGTGFIQSFVRIQMTGTEQGYNTDFRPVQFNEKSDATFTHSLLLSSLGTTTINGQTYYKFGLDINEIGNTGGARLSLDSVQIYQASVGNLTGYNGSGFNSGPSQLVYNLDAGGDKRVELNYRLGSGSGSGDMFLYVPTSDFNPNLPYVYLYSAFGNPNSSDAGFEEWWAQTGKQPTSPSPVPAPPAALLGALALPLLGLFRRRLVG